MAAGRRVGLFNGFFPWNATVLEWSSFRCIQTVLSELGEFENKYMKLGGEVLGRWREISGKGRRAVFD